MRFSRLILILIFLGCQSNSKILPVLNYKIDNDGHQKNYYLSYEGFVNQLGNSFTREDIQDKVYIANFFFTRCPSICPPMRTKLIELSNTFKNEDDFMIVSHTIDPENDSVEVLKSYSVATEIPSPRWQFLRASNENILKLANQYMTNFRPNEDGTDFYHSSYVALIDKNQNIRGFYNILVSEELERLKIDISTLLAN